MKQNKQWLNNFLVDTFNSLLRIEEDHLSQGEYNNISVKEMHVIEVVVNLGEDNSSKRIAGELNITQSSLTIAVNTLVKKGMLEKRTDPADKRIVKIYPTQKAMALYAHHMDFHDEMIEALYANLTEEEMEIFVKGLDSIGRFFASKQQKN